MNLVESFLTALDSLLANKLRAILTMLGIIIGVAAVIALMSIGNGVQESITGEIQSFGTNLISINTDIENSSGYSALGMDDVAALSDRLNVPAVADVSAVIQGRQELVYGGQTKGATVAGVTANYLAMNNLNEFGGGDDLTEEDVVTRARVAVIGSSIVDELFGGNYPVGDSLKIGGISYQVVGILTEQGQGLTGNPDENVYIPITTAQSRLYPDRTRRGDHAVNTIVAQAVSEEATDTAVVQITEILREQHGIAYAADDDFIIFSQTDLLETFDIITGTLTSFLGAIAGISLVVGGIGIMNIMLVSVTERTREIGIRKAVGALKRDILVQFLLESMLLSLIGGILGILLGWAASQIAGRLIDLVTVVDFSTVLLATTFAATVGLVFGIYPAWRAASLRPIEALRYE